MIKNIRALGVFLLVISSLVSACAHEEMSSDKGKEAAAQARRPVAETYWKVFGAMGPNLMGTGGVGGFVGCSDSHSDNSIMYGIENTVFDHTKKDTNADFLTVLRNKLEVPGWKIRSSGNSSYSDTVHGVKVQVHFIKRNAGEQPIVQLLVQSDCVDVGQAKNDLLKYYAGDASDKYHPEQASESPVPTGFPSSNSTG